MLIWLTLIRVKNLLLISLSQYAMAFCLFTVTTELYLYIVCTFCFAAAGNIINDIFDVTTDKINKPHKLIIDSKLTAKNGWTGFYLFNFIGLIATCLLYSKIQQFYFSAILLAIPVLLYSYSRYFKKIALVGNFIIALLTSLSVLLMLWVFPHHTEYKTTIYIFSLFAFLINFIREIVKDVEDINGDRKANLKTLPILIGTKRSVAIIKTVITITLLVFLTVLYIVPLYLKLFILTALIIPMCYCYYLLKSPYLKSIFSNISKILKLIIGLGILSVFFI